MKSILENFNTFFEQLPQKQNRQFEKMITNFVISQEESKDHLLKKAFHNILNEHKDHLKGYVSFLCLATLYRRKERAFDLEALFHNYEQDFNGYSLFFHYRSLKYRASGDLKHSITDAYRILKDDEMAFHSGVLHNFAEIVITLFEENEPIPFGSQDKILDEALQHLETAISLEGNYAKFYATKARFHIYLKDFKEAKECLKLAINYEKKGIDFQLRIAKYYQLLSIVQVQEEYEKNQRKQETYNENVKNLIDSAYTKIDHQIELHEQKYEDEKKETKKMLEAMKEQNLQMLGFFTAIISFTIGSFQIVKNQSLPEAMLLLITLAGILLIAYAGFSFLIFKAEREILVKNGIILIFSLVLIIFSILAYQFEWIGEINTIAYNKNL